MCGGGSVASLCARGRRGIPRTCGDEPWQIFVRFRNQVFPEFTGVSLPELCGEVDAGDSSHVRGCPRVCIIANPIRFMFLVHAGVNHDLRGRYPYGYDVPCTCRGEPA